ncbi:MAG: SIR2 family protein [Planctomycetota bacterium]
MHDPKREIEALRDHLARHDKKIAFLFGAGTSAAINIGPDLANWKSLIPAVAELTNDCRSAAETLGEPFKQAWQAISDECVSRGEDPNIENLLSRIRFKSAAIGPSDTLAGLTGEQLEQLESCVAQTIAQRVTPNTALIPDHIPQDNLARWCSKTRRRSSLELFTVNYDILFERSLEAARIAVFDGFIGSYQPFFDSDAVGGKAGGPGTDWVRLWKLHGSINWRWAEFGSERRVVREQNTDPGEMILPSLHKYEESRKLPYVALMDRLSAVLEQDDVLMIACGYSFSDQHINERIFGALERNPRTHVVSLTFSDIDLDGSVAEKAGTFKNFSVLCPKGAFIGGSWAEWRLSQPLDPWFEDATAGAFSQDDPDADGTPSLTGKLQLGDFGVFCDFLARIADPTGASS